MTTEDDLLAGTVGAPKPKKKAPASYDEIIERHSADAGVDPDLVRSVIGQESENNPRAVSPKGARGLMQLMPGTAARFGVKNIHDPEENIRGGVQYLKFLNDRYQGDTDKVLAGYNAGEGAVDKYNGIPPYRETRKYVPSVKARYQRLKGSRAPASSIDDDLAAGTVQSAATPEQQPSDQILTERNREAITRPRTVADPGYDPQAPPDAAKPQSYDTALNPAEETEFQKWKQQVAPNDSGEDYDLRGAFKAGVTPDPKTSHWPDTFKKPNHPTFSKESQYATGENAARAGTWEGDKFVPSPAGELQAEPGRTDEFAPASPELLAEQNKFNQIDAVGNAAVQYNQQQRTQVAKQQHLQQLRQRRMAAAQQRRASLIDGLKKQLIAQTEATSKNADPELRKKLLDETSAYTPAQVIKAAKQLGLPTPDSERFAASMGNVRTGGFSLHKPTIGETLQQPDQETQARNRVKLDQFRAQTGRLPTPAEMPALGITMPRGTVQPEQPEQASVLDEPETRRRIESEREMARTAQVANELEKKPLGSVRRLLYTAASQTGPQVAGEIADLAGDYLHFMQQKGPGMLIAHKLGGGESALDQNIKAGVEMFKDLGSRLQGQANVPTETGTEGFVKSAAGMVGQAEKFTLMSPANVPLWAVFGAEAALRNQDKPVGQQAWEIGKGVVTGLAIHYGPGAVQKALGKSPGMLGAFARKLPTTTQAMISAGGFGTLSGFESYREGDPASVIAGKAVGAGLGAAALSIRAAAREAAPEVIASKNVPEWLRQAAGRATGKRPVILQSDTPEGEPRFASVYVDPKTGEHISREVDRAEAEGLSGKGRPFRVVPEIQFDQVFGPRAGAETPPAPGVAPINRQLEPIGGTPPETPSTEPVVEPQVTEPGVVQPEVVQPQGAAPPAEVAPTEVPPTEVAPTERRAGEERRVTPGAPPLGRQERRDRLARRIKDERTERRRAQRESETDALTGLANQRSWEKAKPTAEKDPETSILSVDFNNFKAVNDTLGHGAGDRVLQEGATAAMNAAREFGANRVFRPGGDEITLAVPNKDAEAIRNRIEDLFPERDVGGVKVSLSVGRGNTLEEADADLMPRKAARKGSSVYQRPGTETGGQSDAIEEGQQPGSDIAEHTGDEGQRPPTEPGGRGGTQPGGQVQPEAQGEEKEREPVPGVRPRAPLEDVKEKYPVGSQIRYRVDGKVVTGNVQHHRVDAESKQPYMVVEGEDGKTADVDADQIEQSIDDRAHDAAPSPNNDLPAPTIPQIEAGNYKKGHVRIAGMDMSVENPEGSERSGQDASGKKWSITLKSHYGYIRRTEGADGEHVDAYIRSNLSPDYDGPIFVVNQTKGNGQFDEHKVMVGWEDEGKARRAYLENYTRGWDRIHSIAKFDNPTQFREWLKTEDQTKPAEVPRAEVPPTAGPKRVTFKVRGVETQGTVVREYTSTQGVETYDIQVEGRDKPIPMRKSATMPVNGAKPAPAEKPNQQQELQDLNRQILDLEQRRWNYPSGSDQRIGIDRDIRRLTSRRDELTKSGGETKPAPGPGTRPPVPKPETAPGPGPEEKPAPKPAASGKPTLSPEAQAAIDRMKKKFGQQTKAPRGSMGMPAEAPEFGADDVIDAALVGHELFGAGLRDQESWSTQMRDMIGSFIDEHLPTVWEAAVIEHESQGHDVTDLPEWTEPTTKPETEEVAPPEETPEEDSEDVSLVPGTVRLRQQIRQKLASGQSISWRELDSMADAAFGGSRAQGTYEPRDMYDAMEAALAELISEDNFDRHEPEDALALVRGWLSLLPTQTSRQDEQTELQQFSTPPTIGYVAARALQIEPSDIGLEPSAGTGMLAAFLQSMGAKETHVNELSKRRLGLLRHRYQKFDSVSDVDAQRLNAYLSPGIKPTVILMNPPFSSQKGIAKNRTEYGFEHLTSALQRLQEGGRLVAILGESASFNREGMHKTWDRIMTRYNVRANIAIPGKEYAKFGTTFGTQLIVIDKDGVTPGNTFAERMQNVRQDEPGDLEGVLDAIETIPNRKAMGEGSAGDQSTAGGQPGRKGAEPGPSERPGTGEPPSGTETGVGGSTTKGTVPDTGKGGGTDQGGTEPTGDSGDTGTEPGGTAEPGDGAEEDTGLETSDEAAKTESESDLFVQYKPAKLKGGKPHPGRIVESASMAAVEPPDITYKPNLPASVIKNGVLSDLQLERVVYAGQRHAQRLPDGNRAAYFIGDGTGVGKGRMVMGVGLDNWRTWTKEKKKRRILYLSVNYDLVESAERDIKALLELKPEDDLTEHLPFHILNDFRPGDLLDELAGDGIMFSSYSTFIAQGQGGATRFKDLTEWLGDDGLVIFDEAHKAKNAVSTIGGGTQTGERVIDIQIGDDSKPNWKFVYASATGATEVQNMAYMARLGLWGDGLSFHDFMSFQSAIDAGGLGAMEMVARDMKALGMYGAVSLSYKGVTYRNLIHELTEGQEEVYNSAAQAWQMVQNEVEEAMTAQRPNSRTKSLILSQFYSGQQRFFRQVLTAMKLPSIIKDVEKVLREGVEYTHPDTGETSTKPAQVILGFLYTGESQMSREVRGAQTTGGSLEDLDFSPAHILRGFVDRYFPTQLFTDVPVPGTNRTRREPVVDEDGNPVHDPELLAKKQEVMQLLEQLQLPENPLDQVINHFGEGAVAELSGRSHRMIRDPDTGQTEYRARTGTEAEGRKTSRKRANEHEMEDYQSGRKRIAVITPAASTGISLHADALKESGDSRRNHYTVETAWSADAMMQTLGRGHRSGQKSEPEMILTGTNVGGEARFLATIAKRMGSLGALSRGERKASGSTFDNYDFENHYGVQTARGILFSINIRESAPAYAEPYPGFDPMEVANKMGFTEKDPADPKVIRGIKQRDMDNVGVGKFLNRVLALELNDQNVMFKWFIGLLDQVIANAKAEGTFDTGIADVKGDSVRMVTEPQVVARDQTTGAASHYVHLEADEPVEKIPYSDVETMMRGARGRSGISNTMWMQTHSHNVIFVREGAARTDPGSGVTQYYFHVYRPSGMLDELISQASLREKYEQVLADEKMPTAFKPKKKVSPEETAARMRVSAAASQVGKGLAEFGEPEIPTVAEWWQKTHDEAPGFKTKAYHLITSPVIPIWDRLTMRDAQGNAVKLKAMRATTDDGRRVVGINIPARAIKKVLRALGVGASTRTPEEVFNAVYLDGETVELVGGMKLRRTMLRGNRAIELWGVDRNQKPVVLDMGVLYERKGMGADLYLVPTDAAKGIPVVSKLLGRWPPFDATAAAAPENAEIDTSSEGEGGEAGMREPVAPEDHADTTENAMRAPVNNAETQARAEQDYVDQSAQVEAPDENSPDQAEESQDDYEIRQMARISGIRNFDIRMIPEAGFEKFSVSTADVRKSFLEMFDAIGQPTDIRAGRIGRSRALGITKLHSQIIRLRNAWNIPVMAHEAGHTLQIAIYGTAMARGIRHLPLEVRRELLDLGKDLYGTTVPYGGYTAEGFAEFARYYLSTEEAPVRAPKMVDYFENTILPANPELAKALPKVREMIDRYRFQGEFNRDRAQKEGGRRPLIKRVRDAWAEIKDARTDWVDEITPLIDWTRTYQQLTGRQLVGAENPAHLADFFRGGGNAVTSYMLEEGMVDGNMNRVGPSFKQAVVGPIANIGKNFGMWPEELLGTYLWSLRAIERWSPVVLDKAGQKTISMQPLSPAVRKEPRDPGKTLAQAKFIKQTFEDQIPQLQIAAAGWYEWHDGVIAFISELNPDLAPTIRAQLRESAYYAPLQRAFDEIDKQVLGKKRAFTGQGKFLQMKGSQRRVMDPVLQTFLNVERLVGNAIKHRVLTSMTDLDNVEGVGTIFERVPRSIRPETVRLDQIRKALEDIGVDTSGANGDELLTYFLPMQHPGGVDPIMPVVKGNRVEWYYIPVELYNSLSGLDLYRPDRTLMLAMGYWARLFRLGTTGLRASFGLWTNVLKDIPTWYGQSQVKSHNPVKRMNDYVNGMSSLAMWLLKNRKAVRSGTKSEELLELHDMFKRYMVQMSQPLGYDIAATRKEGKRLFRPEGKEILQHPLRRLRTATPIDFMRTLFGFPESFPRIAEMRGVLRERGHRPGDTLTLDDAIEVGLAGKQATVDFLASGRKGKVFNQAVPFFNPNVQGTRSFLRAWKRNPWNALITGMSIMAASLAYWWTIKDEEWYRSLKQWEKNAYWNFKVGDEVLQIPRSQEWGTYFATIPEGLADAAYRKDPEEFKQTMGHWFDVATPPVLPVPLKAGVEQAANWNEFFGRPIVPKSLERQPGAEQYNEYTSEVAKWMGAHLPAARIPFFNIPLNSPMRIDAAIKEFGGGAAADLAHGPRTARAATRAVQGVMGKGKKGQDYELSDLPVIGRGFRRGGAAGTGSVSVDRFYTTFAAAEQSSPSETAPERAQRLQYEDANRAIQGLREVIKANPSDQSMRRMLYRKIEDVANRALSGEQVKRVKPESPAQQRSQERSRQLSVGRWTGSGGAERRKRMSPPGPSGPSGPSKTGAP